MLDTQLGWNIPDSYPIRVPSHMDVIAWQAIQLYFLNQSKLRSRRRKKLRKS